MGKQGASLVSRGEASEGDICTTPLSLMGPSRLPWQPEACHFCGWGGGGGNRSEKGPQTLQSWEWGVD